MPDTSTSPLIFGLVAALANVAGGLILVSRRHWNDLVLRYFIALGAGFMLATTLVHMLPVAVVVRPLGPLLVLAGYFLVHFFEHTIAPHFHFGEETHSHAMEPPSASWAALAGLSVHAFFDGLSIASGQGRRGALRSSLVLAAATFLGALSLVDPAWVAFALPLSAGVTLYVAASDLIPEVNSIRGIRMAAAVFSGVALSLLGAELLERSGLH